MEDKILILKRLRMGKIGWLVSLNVILLFVILLLLPHVMKAATPLDKSVALYPLQCNETFSCPATLLPRVGFWVEVFSRWDTNTAVFHDKENPHRVYSTLNRKEGCRRSRKGGSIDRERKRLKRTLNAVASRLEQAKELNDSQQALHRVFGKAPVSEIRAAANRIRCQSGNRDRMKLALSQFQLYRPTILDALESQNLTPELQYLPFVESAFNPEALSHAGAAGLWQIMPATGRSLGLTINNVVDERYDPTMATYAAAKYFRDSVDRLSEIAFENGHSVIAKDLNPFVVTSYNYGVRGMQRAIKQVGLDYERLLREYKSPSFQTAVKNFYASFLAARHVAKNAESFFGPIETDMGARIHLYSTIKLKRNTSAKRIVAQLGIDQDDLKQLNPALKRVIWKHKALIPKEYELKLPYKENGWDQAFAAIDLLSAETQRPGYQWHRVRSGQTACGIAKSYGASCRALRKLNKLNRKATIYVGQKVKVPTKSGGIGVAKSARSTKVSDTVADAVQTDSQTSQADSTRPTSIQNYRVRSGDTSCKIANRFGMKCGEFLAVNGLTRKSLIRIGQSVIVSALNTWHVVTRGETACEVAKNYKVRCDALLDANRLRRKSIIQVGQRLRIPSQQ